MNEHIPHGHGLSYKKGIADSLLNDMPDYHSHEDDLPEGHDRSYQRGVEHGRQIAAEVASRVR